MPRSIDALTRALIDYAGLFPPAKLDMPAAVENYARDSVSPHSDMLARFICPASRLEQLSETAAPLMPGTFATSGYREYADYASPWRVSVVADLPIEETLDTIDAFNEHHADEAQGLARADTIEAKVSNPNQIDPIIDEAPEDIAIFIEIPLDQDPRGFVAALAGDEAAAKIRCGGVTPDAIPAPEAIADFLLAAASAAVPFKATAGLHHPVRAEHPLTYAPDAPRAVMHGFLNLFLAAALARAGETRQTLLDLLNETNPEAFAFDEEHAAWRDRRLNADQLAETRARFALSYGSCSFDEPIADLKALRWL